MARLKVLELCRGNSLCSHPLQCAFGRSRLKVFHASKSPQPFEALFGGFAPNRGECQEHPAGFTTTREELREHPGGVHDGSWGAPRASRRRSRRLAARTGVGQRCLRRVFADAESLLEGLATARDGARELSGRRWEAKRGSRVP